jgi:DNA-binding GntR family transcriptional regulator
MTDVPEPRISLGEAAYVRLREDIVTCRLAPGQRLTERQLSADTGFGVSPLRDALTRLDHEGLIRILPRKGYQVTPLTPKSIDDLFVVWQIVGPELVRLGIAEATDAQIADAKAGFEELDKLAREAPGIETALHLVRTAEQTFRILAAATRNEYLINLFERISGDMGRIWAMILASDPQAMLADPADHWVRHILTERDADDAAANARRYIAEIHQRVLQTVVRWPSVMSSEVVVPLGH